MLLIRIWNYIRGYVIILVEGHFLEKFINVCMHRHIYMWDIKRHKNSAMSLKMSINGFKKIRTVAKKTDCRVRIKLKKGLPFIVNRYRKRKLFAFGILLFACLLVLLTSFVWTIDISGNSRIGTSEIIKSLEEFGLKPGILKYGVDTSQIAYNMTLRWNDIAWIGVSINGTKASIEIKERKLVPKKLPVDIPCDIVARMDGLIKNITTTEGISVVKPGDTVKKGQILVSGEIKSKLEGQPPRYVHSTSQVLARTWYEKIAAVEVMQIEKKRTGLTEEKYALELFNKIFYLNGVISNFNESEKDTITHKLRVGNDLEFPFGIIVDRYYELTTIKTELFIDEAQSLAAKKVSDELRQQIDTDSEIVKTDVTFVDTNDGGQNIIIVIECLEDIGVEKEIKAK